jgi:hypothetical protein
VTNLSGQAYALTVITPVLAGHEGHLAGHLSALPTADASPLAAVPHTHFARWVLIDALVYARASQRRDQLQASRLLFTSNFDGALPAYLEGLRAHMGEQADAIWGHCAQYPGAANADGFVAYMRTHQVDTSLFFAAYGEQTVDQVKDNLDTQRRLVEFALRAQSSERARWREAFLAEFPHG